MLVGLELCIHIDNFSSSSSNTPPHETVEHVENCQQICDDEYHNHDDDHYLVCFLQFRRGENSQINEVAKYAHFSK